MTEYERQFGLVKKSELPMSQRFPKKKTRQHGRPLKTKLGALLKTALKDCEHEQK